MSFPGGYPAEIKTLVDTFVFRYKLSHEVAAKLVKCSLGIQWHVISPRAPKVVHKPNGFVMGRILGAMRSSLEAPPSQLCSSAPAKPTEVSDSTESLVPLTEKSPSSSTHPSPWADWVEAPEPDREKHSVHAASRKSTEDKMPWKNDSGTVTKRTSRVFLVPVKVRNRSRTPVARMRKGRNPIENVTCGPSAERPAAVDPFGQVPAEMDIPVMVLDQTFLVRLEGDGHRHDVFSFLALPLIIPSGRGQNWICEKSKLIIHAGDIVVGKHFEEGRIRTVSIPAIRLKAIL